MGYVEQSLSSGENIVIKARLHWGMFIGPVINLIIGFVIFAAALLLTAFPKTLPGTLTENFSADLIASIPVILAGTTCCLLIILMLAALQLIRRIGTFFSTEFAVTNKRVIGKSGALRRRSLEIMLTKIESVSVDEPFWGRILNYGTIVVKGSGGTSQPFPFISNAMGLRLQINNLIPPAAERGG
jgi:uncharacterized membrane protein YdbT with pleckstrin-like domain